MTAPRPSIRAAARQLVHAYGKTAEPKTRSAGERKRLEHSIARLRANVDAVELALAVGGPVGQDAQVIVQTAVEVASQLWRLDAFDLAQRDTPLASTVHKRSEGPER